MKLLFPRIVVFGKGQLSELPKFVSEKNILLVTSKGMLSRGPVDTIKSMFPYVKIFSEVEPEPSMKTVKNCKESTDLVIGLGGGSVLDAAKYIAMTQRVRKIMIPTTAGSGSEVTHESVLKVEGKKKAFVNEKLIPDIALVDPELTYSMPKKLTACSGIDALAHAIECIDSKRSNIFTRAIAEEAYKIIKANIKSAVAGDEKARDKMSYAALLAGIAFGNSGTALAHAISYPLSNAGVPHGEAVATVLPAVLDFNEFDAELSSEIKQIIKDVGIGANIPENIEELSKTVMKDKRHLENNPKPVTIKDVMGIYHESSNTGSG